MGVCVVSIDGSLSVSNLTKELDSLIQWKRFAIHGALHVPTSEIDKITKNHPQGTATKYKRCKLTPTHTRDVN